jgi:energy-coupling factor transporter ATP-binding protein EcfA2
MITKLVLKNFKSVAMETYEFTDFDLLVGRNNSGKSTILQAMAIWQFCVDEFHRAKRGGKTGIQVVLPNFTALPVPEFNLLWHDKVDRKYTTVDGKRSKPDYVLIEVELSWLSENRESRNFKASLRYLAAQTAFAIPNPDWKSFREAEKTAGFPKIAYVPPFSGLEPTEEWRDEGPIKRQIGKAQPGSILRNLLYRVCFPPSADEKGQPEKGHTSPPDWLELVEVISRWFSMELLEPKYQKGVDTQIVCEYKQGGKTYDIIAGGSGFHQALTLLAFLYGYKPTVILMDEPDAHMHVNLQREVLDYFQAKCRERGVQFILATHAEELVRGVDASRIISVLSQKPSRLTSRTGILTAMADVSNAELAQLAASPMVLYVEGESDERILRGWARVCGAEEALNKVCFHHMGGGSKLQMKEATDRHFEGIRQILPKAKRLVLFDFDTADNAYHPESTNQALFEWKRRNIENYLLVTESWQRATASLLKLPEGDLLLEPVRKTVVEFFASENLALPQGQTWRNVSANIFQVVDGKKLLFEDKHALFVKLRTGDPAVNVLREVVAGSMHTDEIHDDIHDFFKRLSKAVASLEA